MTVPRILVADDEEYVRAFFRGILKPESYRLRLASDGQETLDLWSREEFDLIIMDIRMPRLSGMEVLRRIRSADDRTMIIMISAYGDMDSVIEAMRLGANDFFAKPFTSVDKIRLDIDNCLERLRLKQENKSLKARIDLCDNSHEIVYASRAMANVIETARQAAVRQPGPDPWRVGHGQGADRPLHPPAGRARTAPSSPSTAGPSRRPCSNPRSSATRRAPSPGRTRPPRAISRPLTAARSSSTRSGRLPPPSRSSS